MLLCILVIGVATGVDLETDGAEGNPQLRAALGLVSEGTTLVFTAEVALKLLAEGYRPSRYFTDGDKGAFNCFDFAIVAAGHALSAAGAEAGSAVNALRMLRLVRLLTFVKGVPMLRGIIEGLASGLKSVFYIVLLLALINYLASICAVIFFGEADPARFGRVGSAMVALFQVFFLLLVSLASNYLFLLLLFLILFLLQCFFKWGVLKATSELAAAGFQVSTMASWTIIAYTPWWGCGNIRNDPYPFSESPFEDDGGAYRATMPRTVATAAGEFDGYICDSFVKSPISTSVFFSVYVVLTAWVIMVPPPLLLFAPFSLLLLSEPLSPTLLLFRSLFSRALSFSLDCSCLHWPALGPASARARVAPQSLFVGVISVGMFEAFEAMKRETQRKRHARKARKQERRRSKVGAPGKPSTLLFEKA